MLLGLRRFTLRFSTALITVCRLNVVDGVQCSRWSLQPKSSVLPSVRHSKAKGSHCRATAALQHDTIPLLQHSHLSPCNSKKPARGHRRRRIEAGCRSLRRVTPYAGNQCLDRIPAVLPCHLCCRAQQPRNERHFLLRRLIPRVHCRN
ncbi:hypothetical protein IWZ00DRAFT_17701 [Phyllosticta capitalensis]